MMAMAKDRERRYATPSELAADIRRFLAYEPIVAAPPGFGYRFSKLARRHRVAVTAGVLLLAALIVGSIGTTWGFLRANRNLALAKSAVRGLLTRVARADLRDEPGTLELRRDILVDALSYHRTFLKENPRDPDMRLATARVNSELAVIQIMLGAFEDAQESYGEAERLLTPLIAETGGHDARLHLAVSTPAA